MALTINGYFHGAIVLELSENFAIIACRTMCGVAILEGMLEEGFVFTHKVDNQWVAGTPYTLNYFKKVAVPC